MPTIFGVRKTNIISLAMPTNLTVSLEDHVDLPVLIHVLYIRLLFQEAVRASFSLRGKIYWVN
jgi:hypothetical protein